MAAAAAAAAAALGRAQAAGPGRRLGRSLGGSAPVLDVVGDVLGEDPLVLQRQADSRRLMVWTRYFERTRELGARAGLEELEAIQALAEATPHPERRLEVARALHAQVTPLLEDLRGSLAELGDPRDAERRAEEYYFEASGGARRAEERAGEVSAAAARRDKRPGDRAPRVPGAPGAGDRAGAAAAAPAGSPPVSAEAWAAALRARRGGGPCVRPSGIEHEEARNGLFWGGEPAVPGQVVAFYPGVVYRPRWHRMMPGYPLISQGNPYLILRPDHSIVDGKVWGFGDGREIPYCPVVKPPWLRRAAAGVMDSSYARASAAGHDWAGVDVRNPWALGHFANHPPRGVAPNLLKAPVDLVVSRKDAAWMRAYFPFLMFSRGEDEHDPEGAARALGAPRGRGALRLGFGMDERLEARGREEEEMVWGEVGARSETLRVLGIVLVASGFVSDGDELLLNYRYNPYRPRPGWYRPVDPEEEERLWKYRGVRAVE